MDSGDSGDFGLGHRRNDDSDTDTLLLAEQQSSNLQLIIDDLRKENSLLRAQFDQAVALTHGIEELHQKNNKLSATVRSLETEKSDLVRRLDIALRSNEELSSQVSEEKQAAVHQRAQESSEKDREIRRILKEAQAQTATLQHRIATVESESEKASLENRSLLSKLDHLSQNAAKYFQRSFSDLDSLIEFLSKPPTPVTPVVADDSKVAALTEGLQTALGRLKKQKSVIRASKKESEQLKTEISKLERELSDSSKRYEQHIKQLEEHSHEQQQELTDRAADDTKIGRAHV
jgi:chromosome segregation ATPase